ncbi:MAG: helix-hairpin-helix domain-containing protein [Myxococcaceae bacterium]|nr:helix-hairpin-helix domain-containing protein [Myxococcaceae bacterium]
MGWGRTGALALIWLALAVVALGRQWVRRVSPSPLSCPKEQWWLDSQGVVGCFEGASRLPAGAQLTLGLKLDLNRATLEELQLIEGIGPSFAQVLVAARQQHQGFRDWEQVDRVPGVGATRLEALKACTEIR